MIRLGLVSALGGECDADQYKYYEAITFDFTSSNSVYAATAGSIAAFALAIAVIGLSREDDRQRGYSVDRSAGSGLFLVAFFCLLICSLLYAEASGFTVCGLLVESSIIAAMPFAAGAVSAFAALVWSVQDRGELLERTARGLMTGIAFVSTVSIVSGNVTLFLLHFGTQFSVTIGISSAIIAIAMVAYWVLGFRVGRIPLWRPNALTVSASAITILAFVWYVVIALGWLGYSDGDLATGYRDGVGFEIFGRSILWSAFLIVARVSTPGRATLDVGRVAAIPTAYATPDQEDPWDFDAANWLKEQPGGQFWTVDLLLDCLRHSDERVRKQPGLVNRAEQFAEANGVRLDVDPDGDGEVYHLYRTDADSPDYPATPAQRADLIAALDAATQP